MINPAPQGWASLEVQARPRLKAFAMKLCREPNLAEDLVQETLIQAFRKFSSYDPRKGLFHKWAAGILINRWKDYNRPKMRGEIPMTVAYPTQEFEVIDPEEIALGNLDPERRLFRTISNLHLSDMLAGLDYPERRVAMLLSKGKTDDEIMEGLGIGRLQLRLAKVAIQKNILEAALEEHASE